MHDISRSEEEIFDELRELCGSPGYVHALAFLCFRDNMVGFADALTLEDIQEMFSPDRLIRTEISTLFGLLVRTPIDFSNPSQDELELMVKRSDALLTEIHSSMSAPLWENLRDSMASGEKPAADFMGGGAALRETIFYGAESAYSFQYSDIAPEKYEADSSWMLQEKGFTIATAKLVANFLGTLVSRKLTILVQPRIGELMKPWRCLSGFTFRISEIAESLSLDLVQIQRIIDAFCLPSASKNESFTSLSSFNATNRAKRVLVTVCLSMKNGESRTSRTGPSPSSGKAPRSRFPLGMSHPGSRPYRGQTHLGTPRQDVEWSVGPAFGPLWANNSLWQDPIQFGSEADSQLRLYSWSILFSGNIHRNAIRLDDLLVWIEHGWSSCQIDLAAKKQHIIHYARDFDRSGRHEEIFPAWNCLAE